MWHRHGGWLGVAFAHACSKERGGVGCVIVVCESRVRARGCWFRSHVPVFVGGCCCQGSHMLSYGASISLSRLWSPSEVFASVICLQYSSVSLSSRSLSSIGKHSRLLSQNVLPRNDVAQGFVRGAVDMLVTPYTWKLRDFNEPSGHTHSALATLGTQQTRTPSGSLKSRSSLERSKFRPSVVLDKV